MHKNVIPIGGFPTTSEIMDNPRWKAPLNQDFQEYDLQRTVNMVEKFLPKFLESCFTKQTTG